MNATALNVLTGEALAITSGKVLQCMSALTLEACWRRRVLHRYWWVLTVWPRSPKWMKQQMLRPMESRASRARFSTKRWGHYRSFYKLIRWGRWVTWRSPFMNVFKRLRIPRKKEEEACIAYSMCRWINALYIVYDGSISSKLCGRGESSMYGWVDCWWRYETFGPVKQDWSNFWWGLFAFDKA